MTRLKSVASRVLANEPRNLAESQARSINDTNTNAYLDRALTMTQLVSTNRDEVSHAYSKFSA